MMAYQLPSWRSQESIWWCDGMGSVLITVILVSMRLLCGQIVHDQCNQLKIAFIGCIPQENCNKLLLWNKRKVLKHSHRL
jgi:hypothetical protein